MSTMSLVSEDEPQDFPKVPPSEVNNLMAAWWLVIGLSLLVFLAVLPMAPAPMADKDSITGTGWLTYVGLAAAMLAFGGFVGYGLRSGKVNALRLCKLGLIIGIILVVAAVTVVLVLASGKPAAAATAAPGVPSAPASTGMMVALGPSPTLGMILLAFVALLPICFSILGFSLSSSMAVKDWFSPPEEEQPAEAVAEWRGAAPARGGVALEESPAGLEAAPHEPYEEPVKRAPRRSFEETVPPELGPQPVSDSGRFEETVPPELGPQPLAGAGRPTMIASDEEFATAVHDASEPESEELLEAEASGSLIAETPADATRIEPELAAEAVDEGPEVVYVEEPEGQEGEVIEYVVEESSAEIDAGDGTDVKPADTWQFTDEDDDDGQQKKK